MEHNTGDLGSLGQKGFAIGTILYILNLFTAFNDILTTIMHLGTILGVVIMIVLNYPKIVKNIPIIINDIKKIFRKTPKKSKSSDNI